MDVGPYPFAGADALTLDVCEGGRVNVHGLILFGVDGDGHREILGLGVTSAEDGAGWLEFLRSLTARGLSGVQIVTSDARRGLVDASGGSHHVRAARPPGLRCCPPLPVGTVGDA